MPQPLSAPIGLLAELTHRCPLHCPYCSNPLELERRSDEMDVATWSRVFREAAGLGILQLHLSGGEPAARGDLRDIVAAARAAGLYSNLITSTIGLSRERLADLAAAGLDHVQISVQDADTASADHIAGLAGAAKHKRELAGDVVAIGLPLTINAVIHRANIGRIGAMVEMAIAWGARRIEIAHAQYHGWALRNRAALMPTAAQVTAALADLERLRETHGGRIAIDAVVPDYFARYPKPCMGGWGSRAINVSPSGLALPCHAAQTIPGLEFWSVREHSLAEIWERAPAFTAFRGDSWMEAPCATCPRRAVDFGGCRCQAFALAGNAAAADPVCHLSPLHERVVALQAAGEGDHLAYEPRGFHRAAAT
jgi:pyrroloquinoline quinone biosynthesis protein E